MTDSVYVPVQILEALPLCSALSLSCADHDCLGTGSPAHQQATGTSAERRCSLSAGSAYARPACISGRPQTPCVREITADVLAAAQPALSARDPCQQPGRKLLWRTSPRHLIGVPRGSRPFFGPPLNPLCPPRLSALFHTTKPDPIAGLVRLVKLACTFKQGKATLSSVHDDKF